MVVRRRLDMKKLVVTLARQFSEEERVSFEKKLFGVFGEGVVEYHLDEELIGGIIVYDGENVYDGSLRHKLQKISDFLKKD